MDFGFLDHLILNSSIRQWLFAAGLFIGVFCLLLLLRRFLAGRLRAMAKRTRTSWDDHLADVVRSTHSLFLVILAAYAATLALTLPARAAAAARTAVTIALVLQAALWGNGTIRFWVEEQRKKQVDSAAAAATSATILGFIARLILFSVAMLMVLDNMGINITALVASLGIGGVAVALAVQNILADLFACLSISLDKPFLVGDFLIVGDLLGTVEHIGLKTTRVRSLSGEQLVFANHDLLNSRIRNFKRMYERRVVFSFGVVYQTAYEKLQGIPAIVRALVETQEDTRFDRAHFKGFGESSLDFEVVYYVLKPDYNVHMDIQQAINLGLYRQFKEQGIDFAYPTRTLYVEKGSEE